MFYCALVECTLAAPSAKGGPSSPAVWWRLRRGSGGGDDWAPLSRMDQLGLGYQLLLTCQRLDREDVHVYCPVMPGSATRRCDALLCRPSQHFLLGPIAVTPRTCDGEGFSCADIDHAGSVDQQRPALREAKICIARALPYVLWSVLRGEKLQLSNWLSRRSLVEAEGQEWDRGWGDVERSEILGDSHPDSASRHGSCSRWASWTVWYTRCVMTVLAWRSRLLRLTCSTGCGRVRGT